MTFTCNGSVERLDPRIYPLYTGTRALRMELPYGQVNGNFASMVKRQTRRTVSWREKGP
jgi:hypothetical protein